MYIKTSYSILESSIKVQEGIKKLKEYGYTASILADKELFGALEFYNAAKKEDILPILSIQREVNGVNFLLICQNGVGYTNLLKLISEEMTFEKIAETEFVFPVVFNFSNATALEELNEKFYVGITKLAQKEEELIKDKILMDLASEKGMKIIPIRFPDHLLEEDYRATNALKAIGEEKYYENIAISEESVNPKNYLLNKKDFIESFPASWVKNLIEIISKCSIEGYSFGNPVPPHFQFCKELIEKEGLSEETTEDELFEYVAKKGLKKRFQNQEIPSLYSERLEFEIKVIQQMKFSGYMLIVQDFVLAAKERDIPVGPGRGSAAGSLVAYAMEITNIDPVPFNLLFERFLNPERVSMPDIDMDFCQTRRQEILDYVSERYGREKVSQIITFGSLGAKGVIRDCSRILLYPQQMADKFAKTVPDEPGISLASAYERMTDEIDKILESPEASRVWNFSKKLEGLQRNLGVHAAGVVITDIPVAHKAPLYTVNGTQVIQYEGTYLEDVDLIKFDFLGLKTLSVIKLAIGFIQENYGKTIDIDTISLNEKMVFEEISSGNTAGMFQIESDGMQKLCKRMKPNRFEDLIALVALYRPGPMESGMLDDFLDRKNGLKPVKYFFDEYEEILKPILEPTYGVIVYQEQVMQIVQVIGGFSLAEADIIRRAMGKKKIDYMKQKAEEFADGAVKKGLNRENAIELFGMIEKFAGYGFNKSHSAAYALITYQTAWLKTFYPAEFMTALLSLVEEIEKIDKYVREARSKSIGVNIISVETSNEFFSTNGKSIEFALSSIKGIGAGVKPILLAREEKPFVNFEDFLIRSKKNGMNKRVFDALVMSGALDCFGINRKNALQNSEKLLKLKKIETLLELINLKENDFSLAEKIKLEKECVGMYITDPFEPVKEYLCGYEIPTLDSLEEGTNHILVFPEEIQNKKAKKTGNEYMILTGYYGGSSVDILAFKNAMSQLKTVNPARPVIVEVTKKGDTLFLSKCHEFKKNNLANFFVVRETPEVEELTILENDFEALEKACASNCKVLHIEGDSFKYSLYR